MKLFMPLIAVCLAVSVSLSAAVPEEKAAEINEKIKQELDQALARLVNAKKICQRYAFVYPVADVKKSPEEIDKDIEAEATAEAAKKFPESWVLERARLHGKAFEQWQLGQKRTFYFKDGLKKPVTGYIREIQKNQIHISTQWYRKSDMTEETLLHFDKGKAKIKWDELIAKFTKINNRNRAEYKTTIIYDIKEKHYKENNYIRQSLD